MLRTKGAHQETSIGAEGVFVLETLERGTDTSRVSTKAVWELWCKYNGEDPATPPRERVGGNSKAMLTRRISKSFGVASKQFKIDGTPQTGWNHMKIIPQKDEEKDAAIEEKDVRVCYTCGATDAQADGGLVDIGHGDMGCKGLCKSAAGW